MQQQDLLSLKAVYFFGALAGCSVIPYVPLVYLSIIHLDKGEIGIITSLTPFVGFVSAPLFSLLVDRHFRNSPVPVICTCFAIAALAYWGFAIPKISFWGACAVAILQAFFAAAVGPLTDSWVLRLLGPENADLYGQQRLWAAVSCGITYFASGLAVTVFGSLLAVLGINILWSAIAIIVYLWAAGKQASNVIVSQEGGALGVPSAQNEAEPLLVPPVIDDTSRTVVTKNFPWFLQPSAIVFYFSMATMGAAFAVVQNFLWIYLTEYKQATPVLLGLTGPFSVAVELPFFFYSKQVLQNIGMKRAILVGHAAMFIRLMLYTVLPSGPGVYFVLLIELLHGCSFAITWSAAVQFANEMAPKSLETTSQGVFNGIHNGLGFGVGSIVAGVVYAKMGPLAMFQGTAASVFISFIVFLIFCPSKVARI